MPSIESNRNASSPPPLLDGEVGRGRLGTGLLIAGTSLALLACGFLLGFCFAQRKPQRLIVTQQGKLDIETVEE